MLQNLIIQGPIIYFIEGKILIEVQVLDGT